MAGCSNGTVVEPISQDSLAILNGEKVPDGEHMAACALYDDYGFVCSCTLITPTWVMTSGHCLTPEINQVMDGSQYKYDASRHLKVLFGSSIYKPTYSFPAENAYVHPGFYLKSTMEGGIISTTKDLALIHLAKAVPPEQVEPVPPLPPELAPTVEEIDSQEGVWATAVGFGSRSLTDSSQIGEKYMYSEKIDAYCSDTSPQSAQCPVISVQYSLSKMLDGFLYIFDRDKCVLPGDSGGSLFVERNSKKYVIGPPGITAANYYGMNFTGWDIVCDHYDFILAHVDDLPEGYAEICDNGIDDNGDKRVDCDDPGCKYAVHCRKEICDNHVDDNANGLFDCDDPDCAGSVKCLPENCANGVDDNENGLRDCQEPSCFEDIHCQPEICDNHVDDNENGLVDCADAGCVALKMCKKEICDNRVDDNENGLVDCDDPDCTGVRKCQPEICDNGRDDNSNGLVDCRDPQCAHELVCIPEDCANGADDNGNGLKDCEDPQCSANLACAIPEKDEKDDDKGDGCSGLPTRPSDTGLVAWLLALLGVGALRRRRTN